MFCQLGDVSRSLHISARWAIFKISLSLPFNPGGSFFSWDSRFLDDCNHCNPPKNTRTNHQPTGLGSPASEQPGEDHEDIIWGCSEIRGSLQSSNHPFLDGIFPKPSFPMGMAIPYVSPCFGLGIFQQILGYHHGLLETLIWIWVKTPCSPGENWC